jgi:hypothetical protein
MHHADSQYIVVYPSGLYGTFIEWILNFLEDPSLELPFNQNGNSHKFRGHGFLFRETLLQHVESGRKYKFCRAHPDALNDDNLFNNRYDAVLQKSLTFFKDHFDKIVFMYHRENTTLWYENNKLDKILMTEEDYEHVLKPPGYTREQASDILTDDPVLKIKHTIDNTINAKASQMGIDNLMGWGKTSIYDFEIWELRELLSFCWFSRSQGAIEAYNVLKNNNPDVLFVDIEDLKNNFFSTIEKIVQHHQPDFSLSTEQRQKLYEIQQQWLPLQKQINKDTLCNKIVECIKQGQSFDWSDQNLSIVDEAWIQKSLREHGILIKCNGLNVFPTNTLDFVTLLEFDPHHAD